MQTVNTLNYFSYNINSISSMSFERNCASPFAIIEEQTWHELDATFFLNVIKLEETYKTRPSQFVAEELIKAYSDCIFHFDHQSESVSVYFQDKLKKLLITKRRNDKCYHIQQQVRSDALQTPNLHKLQLEHKDSMGKYKNKVQSIIDKQKKILAQRRTNRKKYLGNSSVFTMSMDSLFQSPEKPSSKSLTTSKARLFESLIDGEDDQNDKKTPERDQQQGATPVEKFNI